MLPLSGQEASSFFSILKNFPLALLVLKLCQMCPIEKTEKRTVLMPQIAELKSAFFS